MEPTRRRVVSNIAALLSGSAIAQALTALILLLTARQLGASGYGQIAACITLASFTAILFNLGLDTWLLREGGRRALPLGELVGSVLTIKVAGGMLWLGFMFALASVLDQDTFPSALLRLSALATLLDSLLATALTAFKASLRSQVSSFLESGTDAVWLLATLLLVGLGVRQAEGYVAARVAVLLVGVLIAVLLVRRATAFSGTRHTLRRVVREAPPFAASEFLAWVSMRADVLIIAFVLGQQAVGLYAPAVGFVNALFLVPGAVYGVMMPVLSRLYTTKLSQAEITARRSVVLLLAVGLGLALALAVGAPLLVAFLGESFGGSLGLLRILSVIVLFKSGSFALAAILVAIGRQVQRTVVQAVAALLNVGLNLWVVDRLGIYGVAWVYVLTELLLLVGYGWVVQRYRPRPVVLPTVSPTLYQ